MKRKEEELMRRERELQSLQSRIETMQVSRELRQRRGSGNSLDTWSEREVADWLEQGLQLPQYVQTFINNHIGGSVLTHLTESDLDKMGVVSIGHQRVILGGISRLSYTLEYPMLGSAADLLLDRSLTSSFLNTASFPSLPSVTPPPGPSTPQRQMSAPGALPLTLSVSPPLTRTPSLATPNPNSKCENFTVVIFHRRVSMINVTCRAGVLVEGEHHDGRLSSSSSTDSENSLGQFSSRVGAMTPETTRDIIERVVFYWPGESSYGDLVVTPPFEGKTSREVRHNAEIVVEVHFNKTRFKKKIISIRHRVANESGATRHQVPLKSKAGNSQLD